MEQGPAGGSAASAAGGVLLPLSESEQQRYSELFSRCCPPPEAAAGGSSVGELFRASQLPPDTLHQITEVCGAKRVGYFGPAQFYLALKLIAAAQAGFPVRLESVKNELPLPRFPALQADADARYGPPAELHPVKFQVPHAALEKNCYKRAEEGDKQLPMKSDTLHTSKMDQQQEVMVPNLHLPVQLSTGLFQWNGSSRTAAATTRMTLGGSRRSSEITTSTSSGPCSPTSAPSFQVPWQRISSQSPSCPSQSFLTSASLKPIHDCTLFDSYPEALPGSQQSRECSRTEASAEEAPDKPALTQDGKKDDKQALKASAALRTIPKEFQHFTMKTAAQEPNPNVLRARPRSRSYSSTSIEDAMKKGEEPPTPPPRPQKSHSRASSLDLNKVFQQSSPAVRSAWLPPPPALPPRPSVAQAEQPSELELPPQLSRAPAQAEESSPAKKEVVLAQPPSKPARRKLRTEAQGLETPEMSPTISVTSALPAAKTHLSVPRQPSRQKRAIQTAIRKNKEANAVLARLNSELQQQLKEVHKERIALETQLEQLRPVTVL
ncbi:ralBP1-associated Eps domain-containing protein 2 isoform X3 [Pogoniulus pusillus]|uniref:ralBP1-associated Eps domain-containing protein 2 isoform X3 n=1 Tax=Pogoniulus pusillus TaxID=488313 RepID=UPI0030B988C7